MQSQIYSLGWAQCIYQSCGSETEQREKTEGDHHRAHTEVPESERMNDTRDVMLLRETEDIISRTCARASERGSQEARESFGIGRAVASCFGSSVSVMPHCRAAPLQVAGGVKKTMTNGSERVGSRRLSCALYFSRTSCACACVLVVV